MRSRVLSLVYPLARVLLAFRVAMLLLAPAMMAQASGGEWQQFPDSPVADQPITALLADRSGHVWAGTEERGLARWDGDSWTSLTISAGLPDMRVVALFEDSRERLWVATGNGLGYFPADRDAFRRVGAGGAPALPVTAFAEDGDGRVWLGTARGLAAWREDGAFEVAEGVTGRRIASLARTGNGEVWAIASDELWRGSPEGWKQAEPQAPSGVNRLTTDESGALYALAGGKVWRLDDTQWMALPAPFDTGVTAFVVAGARLWAASAGLVFATEGGITQGYDGSPLRGNGVTDVAVGQDGSVWFASRAGLAAYRPGATLPTIGSVRVNGARADVGGIALARNRIRAVNVTVTESRGAGPQATVLYAQLDGVDETPRIVNGELAATYKDVALAPGQHTLRVWAVDGDFNRSEETRVTINVPDLTYLPFGLALPTEAVQPLLAVISLVFATALTVFAAVALVRRGKRQAAAREAARVRAILSITGNPYEGALAHDPALRAEQAQEIAYALTGPDARSVVLLGARGMGKTTLLRQLASSGAAKLAGAPLHAAYVDLAMTGEEVFFAAAMNALYDALTSAMVGERPRLDVRTRAIASYGEREFAADAARLFACLRPTTSAPLNAVLLLDNADALDAYGGAQRDAVRRLLIASTGQAAALRLVLAAKTPPVAVEGLTDLLSVVQLAPLPAPALERLLLTPAKGAYEWDAEATRGAIALSQGRPGKLREIAERAVASARGNGRVRIGQTDVAPVRPTP
jgi:hypothetical protein